MNTILRYYHIVQHFLCNSVSSLHMLISISLVLKLSTTNSAVLEITAGIVHFAVMPLGLVDVNKRLWADETSSLPVVHLYNSKNKGLVIPAGLFRVKRLACWKIESGLFVESPQPTRRINNNPTKLDQSVKSQKQMRKNVSDLINSITLFIIGQIKVTSITPILTWYL